MNEAVVLNAEAATDVGQRDHNEDNWLVDRELGLALVADGVGGHNAGEVASALTCSTISAGVAEGLTLREAVEEANRSVREAIEQGKGRQGMASTVVGLQCDESGYRIAWVGDSRAYLWDGMLHLLTQDHSFVQTLVDQGQITPEQARVHPRKNIIVQAIGLQQEGDLAVGENQGQLPQGAELLLCSDGLSDVLDSGELAAILARDEEPASRCKAMVQLAVDKGGQDNITALLVDCAGAAASEGEGAPRTYWHFDPQSGEYHGMATAAVEYSGDTGQTVVRRIAPRGAEDTVQNFTPGSEPGVSGDERKDDTGAQRSRRLRIFLGAALIVAVILGLISQGVV